MVARMLTAADVSPDTSADARSPVQSILFLKLARGRGSRPRADGSLAGLASAKGGGGSDGASAGGGAGSGDTSTSGAHDVTMTEERGGDGASTSGGGGGASGASGASGDTRQMGARGKRPRGEKSKKGGNQRHHEKRNRR